MEIVRINNLSIDFGDNELLKIDKLLMNSNERVGLIGDNGVGKTSLLKAIYTPKKGVKLSCSPIYVPQILNHEQSSGGEIEKERINKAFKDLKNSSNGLFLLDEPTSNLDQYQQEWLINKLLKIKRPFIIISHDRHFLNTVVDVIWEIRDKKIFSFKGKYFEFEQFRNGQVHKLENEYQRQEKNLRKLKKTYQKKVIKGGNIKKKEKNVSSSDWKTKNPDRAEKNVLKSSQMLSKKIKNEDLVKPKKHHSITLKNLIKNLNSAKSTKINLVSIAPQNIKIDSCDLFNIPYELNIRSSSKVILSGCNGTGKSVFLKKCIKNNSNVK